MNKIEYVPATILAACVLHNICIDYPDENVNLYIAEGQEHAERNRPIENVIVQAVNRTGIAIRNEMARSLVN